MNILSIQSHVAFGHVGNASATFPLQRLGHEVWAVNTVQFSNHTGYGAWRGEVFSGAAITEVVQGVEDRGVLPACDGVLSGYMGDAAIGEAVLDAVARVRDANPDALYCCDPVIGDVGRGVFVRPGIPEFMRDRALPLADVIVPNQFELELFHGPTLAFKDVAMQLISRLMDHVLAQRGQRTTIVVATSGDTGGAAVDAFVGLDNVDLIVLFPQGRISDVQRRMMTTTGAGNVHALAIEGTFDDCQAIVKGLFNNHRFRDTVSLSGVNSINWARIVAQVVYYFTSAVALGSPLRTVDFTVPTGNFGDIFAGFVAKRMGLPVRWLRIASNVNDILPRTLKTGIYEVREVHASASPSMDIQVSSNFERLLFEASGRDTASVRRLMESLKQSGRFVLPDAMLAAIRAEFDAGRADETETSAAIRAAWYSECSRPRSSSRCCWPR